MGCVSVFVLGFVEVFDWDRWRWLFVLNYSDVYFDFEVKNWSDWLWMLEFSKIEWLCGYNVFYFKFDIYIDDEEIGFYVILFVFLIWIMFFW